MDLARWICAGGTAVFILSAFYQVMLVTLRGKNDEWSAARGSVREGMIYSLTGAMAPWKKETAFLHLPTYGAGIVYHIGSFVAFGWLAIHCFGIGIPAWIRIISIAVFLASVVSGAGILLKRFINPRLQKLSVPDDYFSNGLVTGFQIVSLLVLLRKVETQVLFFYAGLLFLYIPVGKLRHVIFFFIARLYLGRYYGKRGIWPPSRNRA